MGFYTSAQSNDCVNTFKPLKPMCDVQLIQLKSEELITYSHLEHQRHPLVWVDDLCIPFACSKVSPWLHPQVLLPLTQLMLQWQSWYLYWAALQHRDQNKSHYIFFFIFQVETALKKNVFPTSCVVYQTKNHLKTCGLLLISLSFCSPVADYKLEI